MKKINPTKELLNLKGVPLKDKEDKSLTFGYYLSEILLLDKKAGKMKSFILAQKLFDAKDEIELDDADLALIKDAVEKNEAFNNLILGQILQYLETIK